MAIATLAAYRTVSFAPHQKIPFTKNNLPVTGGRLSDLWTTAPLAGAAPTTAVVPTRATAGALGQFNPAADMQLIRATLSAANAGVFWLIDRLSHQGGLSGTVITAQTTNLPTAALTRYTSGVGVMMGLTIYTIIGTTATTVTVSYTNEAGTAGRTSEATVFGSTSFREAGRMILLPLQAGDIGVRSVESVTVLATTGTAGNFGVTLFRPILALSVPVTSQSFEWDPLFNLGAQAPDIVDNACLSWLAIMNAANTGVVQGELSFAEN